MTESVTARFWKIFSAPGEAMAAVRDNPRWTLAALALILVMTAFGAATLHITGPENVDMMRDTRFGRMLDDEQIAEQYARYDDISGTDRLLHGLQTGFGVFVGVFISGLVYLLFCKLAGGTGSFAQTMGAVYWSSLIGVGLGSLVKWPLVLAKQSAFSVSTGLGLLAPDAAPTSATYQLLGFFDFFVIWSLVVLVIGFQHVHGFDRNKSATVTVMSWLLMNLAMFGLGRLFM